MKKALLTFFILTVLTSSHSGASYRASVQGIRYSTYKHHTRVVVDLNGRAVFNSNRLQDPERLYFDLKQCTLSKNTGTLINVNNGTLQRVHAGQFSKDTVRITLDLEGKSMYSAFVLENPNRLVIDVYRPRKTAPSKSKDGVKEKDEAPSYKPEYRPERKTIKTIVIDPGHGGKDPGAIGQNGLKEKDVVLKVGKRLGEILKKRFGVKIIYTRQTDVFIPLNERTEIANSKNSDLFISVHANANRKRSAKGIETYILNWTNDDESIRVAARENNVSIDKMKSIRGKLQIILDDLTRSYKKSESVRLARNVQDAMINTVKSSYRNTIDLGVKQALFYVLVGAEMPSILVEISFISNSEEERLLANGSYRNKLAEGIADGVADFIKNSTLIVQNQ
jgi:N-acetylmuramoyl-L-alanine amidase